ncbi:30S ribosomal protein S17 [Candidatus Saccharibacteria bacterium]|nr:30S ribosomal protein S17 [Candidatus Saccharibacteria bacterium]MBQ3469665.1 30S ribosomal protein S17 [Candidatus Saccharibacteria bacterium]
MAKTIVGLVSSDKRDKTITVSVASRETHPLYRKQYTKTRKYTAHDEKNEAKVGDKVEIVECRPFSKTVNYNLVKILEKSRGAIALKEDVNEVELPEKVGADAVAKAKETSEEAEE